MLLIACFMLGPAMDSNAGSPCVQRRSVPCKELLRKGLVNDASIVLGAQTNDSNLFLFRSHTKDRVI